MFSASAWAPRLFVDVFLDLLGAIRVLRWEVEMEGGRRGLHTRGIEPARVDAVCVCARACVYRLSGFWIFLVACVAATAMCACLTL